MVESTWMKEISETQQKQSMEMAEMSRQLAVINQRLETSDTKAASLAQVISQLAVKVDALTQSNEYFAPLMAQMLKRKERVMKEEEEVVEIPDEEEKRDRKVLAPKEKEAGNGMYKNKGIEDMVVGSLQCVASAYKMCEAEKVPTVGDGLVVITTDPFMGLPSAIKVKRIASDIEDQTSESVLVFKGPQGRINRTVWGPLNKTIVSAGENSVVRVWDSETGKLLNESDKEDGHKKPITSLAKSNDCSHFLTGSLDKDDYYKFICDGNAINNFTVALSSVIIARFKAHPVLFDAIVKMQPRGILILRYKVWNPGLIQFGESIVNLHDEVELYFERDTIGLGDYYSPRNEIEALNVVLQAVAKSQSNNKYTDASKNVLRILREEIFQRIHEIGSGCSEETKIIGDNNNDKEKCLLDWSVKNDVTTKLDIAYVEGAGRGAIAIEDLDVGDIALEIPVSVIISEDLLHESEMYPILEKIDGISGETMLLLWSMKEKYNINSKFRLYFDTLPENFNTGLSFGIDAVMALDGMLLLDEIGQAKEHLRAQYDELILALSNHPDMFPPELYTFEKFLWACELWYSNSMKVDLGDGNLRTCLIPVAGFLNHSTLPPIMNYGKIDTVTNSLKIPLSRACNSGERCFLSYGKLSSSHLLTFYGFLPQGDNPYDIISLDFDFGADDDGEPASEWSTHMVRGTWLSKKHGFFLYGLPSVLLAHLRRAQNPDWRSIVITQEILVTELNILKDLASTFEGMMEGLGDQNLDYKEGASWDVKCCLKVDQNRVWDAGGKFLSSGATYCHLKQLEKIGMIFRSNIRSRTVLRTRLF